MGRRIYSGEWRLVFPTDRELVKILNKKGIYPAIYTLLLLLLCRFLLTATSRPK